MSPSRRDRSGHPANHRVRLILAVIVRRPPGRGVRAPSPRRSPVSWRPGCRAGPRKRCRMRWCEGPPPARLPSATGELGCDGPHLPHPAASRIPPEQPAHQAERTVPPASNPRGGLAVPPAGTPPPCGSFPRPEAKRTMAKPGSGSTSGRTCPRRSGGEGAPTLAPPSGEDGAAGSGSHTDPKPVRLVPLPVVGLIGPLHVRTILATEVPRPPRARPGRRCRPAAPSPAGEYTDPAEPAPHPSEIEKGRQESPQSMASAARPEL
jgi:hypothetical protein